MKECEVLTNVLICYCGGNPCPKQTSYPLPRDFMKIKSIEIAGTPLDWGDTEYGKDT